MVHLTSYVYIVKKRGWEATDVWEFFEHHQSFNDVVYPWSYSWLADMDRPSFIRDLVQVLSPGTVPS